MDIKMLHAIPDNLIDSVEIVTWLFKQPVPWIELDLTFNQPVWLEEGLKAAPYFVEHREGGGHSGWTSCCIHGLAIDKTGTDFTAPLDAYHWTKLSELTPTIKTFWEQFPFEHLLRIRFMSLEPGGHIALHNDNPGEVESLLDEIIPINIAITHPDDCYMNLPKFGNVPFSTGKMFLVNITNDHMVVNKSNQRRLHIIGHGYVGKRKKEFCDMLVRCYNKQYEIYRKL